MKTFIIGDIHGGNKALEQVLERSGFNREKDTLISLGDIADGWSETSECVDTLLTIKNLIAIRGNHDVWCYDWFKSGLQPLIWTQQGGQATLDSYIKTGKVVDQTHKDFWNNQIDWYIDSQQRLFIHGGFPYTLPGDFEKQASYRVNGGSIARECHWDRELYTGFRKHHPEHLPKLLKEKTERFTKIFIGHTAIPFPYLPFNSDKLWNLDTGAGWNGKLTIMNVDTEEYWQSDLVKELYPNEKGR